jgi:hypothetical protein
MKFRSLLSLMSTHVGMEGELCKLLEIIVDYQKNKV